MGLGETGGVGLWGLLCKMRFVAEDSPDIQ